MPRRARLICALCLVFPAAPVAAQTVDYTVTVIGLKAGVLSIAANTDGKTYAVSSQAASAGLAGLFRSFSYKSKVMGAVENGRLRPKTYAARSEGSRAGRGAELAFENGVPQVISAASEPDPDAPKVDPATLNGVVDPLTGLYSVLRDTTAKAACQLDLTMYDGHRVSRVTLSGARPTEDGVLCDGLYRRVAGYPAKDLAERASFPFTVQYVAQGEVMQAQELTMDSLFGPARMTRN